MSELDLNAIEARSEKATAPPWYGCRDGQCSCMAVWCADHPIAKIVSGQWGDRYTAIRVADGIGGRAEAYIEITPYGEVDLDRAVGNMQFIFYAREDVPALCAEVRRLRMDADLRAGYEVNAQQARNAVREMEAVERSEA